MDYIELKITVSDTEHSEILMAELAEYPFESFQNEDDTLLAYIPEDALHDCKAEINAMLNSRGIMRHCYTPVATQNWNAEWESGFEPVEVEGRLSIRAPFHATAPKGVTQVTIMPHMSFGTGHHATTWLMTSELLDLDVRGKRGLDMGSGTGVLSIVAALHGAASIDAVDIDDWADENCRENCAMNGVSDRVKPLLGDVRLVQERTYDFILANINRNVLTTDMPRYAAMLASGGDLLLSGFLEQDLDTVRSSAQAAGLTAAGVRLRDGWVMIHCVK